MWYELRSSSEIVNTSLRPSFPVVIVLKMRSILNYAFKGANTDTSRGCNICEVRPRIQQQRFHYVSKLVKCVENMKCIAIHHQQQALPVSSQILGFIFKLLYPGIEIVSVSPFHRSRKQEIRFGKKLRRCFVLIIGPLAIICLWPGQDHKPGKFLRQPRGPALGSHDRMCHEI